MEYIKQTKKKICTNCGKNGHEYRVCNEPITSFGIINIKIADDKNESLLLKKKFSTYKNVYYKIISSKYPDINCVIANSLKLYTSNPSIYQLNDESINYDVDEQLKKLNYYRNKILFMMVSRKHSLGYIEFIRGKYDVFDPCSIINLFEQMTMSEIKFIRKHKYDDILYHFLNRNHESKETVLNKTYEGFYSNEYCEAKIKFNILSDPIAAGYNIQCNLYFYTKHIKPKWIQPEWGFPKGKRNSRTEENLNCARREFEEETGYTSNDYIVMNKIVPLEEKLIGTNGINYKHIYYLAINNNEIPLPTTNYDTFEIGDIQWFTYDDAIYHIRPYHVEKKNVLTKIYLFVLNYLIHNNLEL